MKEEYRDIFQLKTALWNLRVEYLKTKKSAPWSLDNLNGAIKKLKNVQSRDPSGLVNDLFKPDIMEQDMAVGLLDLVNGMKSELFIPEMTKLANITSIYKNKGSRQDMKNERGIFGLSLFRKIIDKMVYEDKYYNIDSFMSDSNIGARKEMNIRNHLFVIYQSSIQ